MSDTSQICDAEGQHNLTMSAYSDLQGMVAICKAGKHGLGIVAAGTTCYLPLTRSAWG